MRFGRFSLTGLCVVQLSCSLVTDFSGVSDGNGGASADGGKGGSGGSAQGVSFPRLAVFETSNPKAFDDPSYEADAARVHILIMGVYPGWGDGTDAIEKTAKAIKTLSTKAKTKVFVHVYTDHFQDVSSGNAYVEVIDKLNDMGWWLYQSGTTGTKVGMPDNPNTYITNPTLYTPKDSDGYTFIEWYARYLDRTFREPSPSLDGLETGYMGWRPNVSGDYDRDGTTDSATDPAIATAYREGYAKYFQNLKELAPEKLQLADFTAFGENNAVHPELDGLVHGAMINRLIGETWSPETYAGWETMMARYRSALTIVLDPKLVVFDMKGVPGDYQAFRYGLASCLMDDGYFSWDDEAFGVDWFDEYDVDLGGRDDATADIGLEKWRISPDFERGIALVNPKDNGVVTLDLEAPFTRIQGNQDQVVNDGTASQSVTLKDRDGIILLRE